MPEPQPTGVFRWTQAAGGRVLECLPLLTHAPHFFTTRDLTLCEDDSEWAAVAAAIGVELARLRLMNQVHGVAVAVTRSGDDSTWIRPEADVIVSDDPSAAVGVRVADCAPILLVDSINGVVAAAHAGWRGTMRGAATVAVTTLKETFGTHPGDVIAAIGPSLGACCGEVGAEVVSAFRSAGHSQHDLSRWFRAGDQGRARLDLWRANADQLASAGVPPGQIHTAGLCTKSHSGLFHSYRAHGPAVGRMVGVIRAGKGRRRKDEGERI